MKSIFILIFAFITSTYSWAQPNLTLRITQGDIPVSELRGFKNWQQPVWFCWKITNGKRNIDSVEVTLINRKSVVGRKVYYPPFDENCISFEISEFKALDDKFPNEKPYKNMLIFTIKPSLSYQDMTGFPFKLESEK